MDIRKYRSKIKQRSPEAVLEVKKDLAFQIGKEFEKVRILKGYTQDQLAREIKTKQSSIARLERGSNLPSLRFLKKIADELQSYIEVRLHSISISVHTPIKSS